MSSIVTKKCSHRATYPSDASISTHRKPWQAFCRSVGTPLIAHRTEIFELRKGTMSEHIHLKYTISINTSYIHTCAHACLHHACMNHSTYMHACMHICVHVYVHTHTNLSRVVFKIQSHKLGIFLVFLLF